MEGKEYFISDYLKAGAVTATEKLATREDARVAVEANAVKITSVQPFASNKVLETGETSDAVALVIYMPTTVGNEANAKPDKDNYYNSKLSSLGVMLYASQAMKENDSFGDTYDENAPAQIETVNYFSGNHEITENIQAPGRFGAVEAVSSAQFTINADVYAEYGADTYGVTGAMAVCASGNSRVVINGGDFRQVNVPANDPCDLIYAIDKATIEINGGTFKAVQPDRTLNVKDSDRGKAKILVKGGSFYKYDPSNPTLGDNEVFVVEGYHVEQDGDWYTVVAD